MAVQVWAHATTGQHHSSTLDPSLDSSGWTPRALERLLDLAARLPFDEAAQVARSFGLLVSRAELERLHAQYAGSVEAHVDTELLALFDQPLADERSKAGRVMVVQTDGVFVQGRADDGSARAGSGIEIKTALVYPQQAPLERVRLASVCSSEALLPLTAGLLRHAGVRVQDTLIGLSDGANWIQGLFEHLGVHQHILDVFHSGEYLDTVMHALGWDDERRAHQRQGWVRGELRARDWLQEHVPEETNTLGWDQAARVALHYLRKRVDQMDYPEYRAQGWPIGSGQIEGMNKHVIGSRMKGSGMRWSRSGAARMASVRAQLLSRRPLARFHDLRRHAFPTPLF